jgi:TonB family protein
VSLQSKRKLIVDVRPLYPLLARKANLSGLVRLRVTVSPAGYPVDTELLGGSPVLVKAATDAVSKARWEPAPAETREIVQIRFEAKMGPSL